MQKARATSGETQRFKILPDPCVALKLFESLLNYS